MPWKINGSVAASLVLEAALGVFCLWGFNYYWDETYPWKAVSIEKIVSKREFILSDGRKLFWTYPKEIVRPHDRTVLFLNKLLEKLTSMASAAKSDHPDATIPAFNAVIPNTHRSTADIDSKDIYILVLYPEQLSVSDKQTIELANIRLGSGDVFLGPELCCKLQDIMAANGILVTPDTP